MDAGQAEAVPLSFKDSLQAVLDNLKECCEMSRRLDNELRVQPPAPPEPKGISEVPRSAIHLVQEIHCLSRATKARLQLVCASLKEGPPQPEGRSG